MKDIEAGRSAIFQYLIEGKDVYAFFDTETTGKNPFPKIDLKRDRLLEIGIVFYGIENCELIPIMAGDSPVVFHEFVNPFSEPEKEKILTQSVDDDTPAVFVHGITKEFLHGGFSELLGYKLEKPAESFNEVSKRLNRLCLQDSDEYFELENEIIFVAHNSSFDVGFMNAEYEKNHRFYGNDLPLAKDFESMFKTIDSIEIAKQLVSKFALSGKYDSFKSEGISVPKGLMELIARMTKSGSDILERAFSEQNLQLRTPLVSLVKTLSSKSFSFDSDNDFTEAMNFIYGVFNRRQSAGFSLDYLSHYFDVKGDRTFHGALLDAQFLAGVYSALMKLQRDKGKVLSTSREFGQHVKLSAVGSVKKIKI